LAEGLSVQRINSNNFRQFARAKNDRLDARLIAEYVAIMPTRVVRLDPARSNSLWSSPRGGSLRSARRGREQTSRHPTRKQLELCRAGT
jgi:transposase